MRLVHTLLFLARNEQDIRLAGDFLTSMENSAYKTLVVYNQGNWSSDALKAYLAHYDLDCRVIGDGVNVGTAAGRQRCFEFIWENMPDAKYISELHLDMLFPSYWEDALVQYLEDHDEPLICCGIVDKNGAMPALGKNVTLPDTTAQYADFLNGLRTDSVVHGFTNPCIHVSDILKKTGGYDVNFLRGRQCFEDDSMLLGYYYYFGTKRGWYPKVNYNSVVYHAVAGQRMTAGGNTQDNYAGLVRQYGAMGLKALSELHNSAWQKRYFSEQYQGYLNPPEV
jgi:hypothetical protein